jgi:hypothetical protein
LQRVPQAALALGDDAGAASSEMCAHTVTRPRAPARVRAQVTPFERRVERKLVEEAEALRHQRERSVER